MFQVENQHLVILLLSARLASESKGNSQDELLRPLGRHEEWLGVVSE